MVATAASAIVTAGTALWLVRAPLARAARTVRPSLTPFLRYLWPVFVGLLGIAVLTTADLLIVRARFAPAEAGEYAAASAFARSGVLSSRDDPRSSVPTHRRPSGARRGDTGHPRPVAHRHSGFRGGACAVLRDDRPWHRPHELRSRVRGRRRAPRPVHHRDDALRAWRTSSSASTSHAAKRALRGSSPGWCPCRSAVLMLIPTTIDGVIVANVIVGTALLAAHELLVGSTVGALHAGFVRFSHRQGALESAPLPRKDSSR